LLAFLLLLAAEPLKGKDNLVILLHRPDVWTSGNALAGLHHLALGLIQEMLPLAAA
jgi:hypothetical protein